MAGASISIWATSRPFSAVEETGSSHVAAALFERMTRSVNPTLAAKRLRPRAEAILEDVRDVSRAMRDASVAYAHQRSLVITIAGLDDLERSLKSRALSPMPSGIYRRPIWEL